MAFLLLSAVVALGILGTSVWGWNALQHQGLTSVNVDLQSFTGIDFYFDVKNPIVFDCFHKVLLLLAQGSTELWEARKPGAAQEARKLCLDKCDWLRYDSHCRVPHIGEHRWSIYCWGTEWAQEKGVWHRLFWKLGKAFQQLLQLCSKEGFCRSFHMILLPPDGRNIAYRTLIFKLENKSDRTSSETLEWCCVYKDMQMLFSIFWAIKLPPSKHGCCVLRLYSPSHLQRTFFFLQ